MEMNRRDFIKFLGKATVATGVAALVGLPETTGFVVDKPFVLLNTLEDGECLYWWDGMTMDHIGSHTQWQPVTMWDGYVESITVNDSDGTIVCYGTDGQTAISRDNGLTFEIAG